MRALLLVATIGGLCNVVSAQTVSPLFARGYNVLPDPQRVSLGARNLTFSANWNLNVDKSVAKDDVAVESLRDDLDSRFNLKLSESERPAGVLTLRIAAGSIQVGNAEDKQISELEQQAYRLELHPQQITITANAPAGLFYGVETLTQLLKSDHGALSLPEGSIEDWPDLQLRLMYWDDAHHSEHLDELKREVRQAAFYKMNGFELKLDGHFQFKSAPAVVEPYAFTPAQLQDLTNYALHYHVQLIPYLDGPGHIAFVLKHPEYYKLRAFPDSNYEMCVANPDTYTVLEGMYQDLLDATKGAKYFYVSMDEPYYLGLAHNAQCDEAALTTQLGSSGQLFAQFMSKAGNYLHDHGRTVLFWGAFPLKPSDVSSLPTHLIGNMYGRDVAQLNANMRRRDFEQILSAKYINDGDSKLFPLYFQLPPSDHLHLQRHDPPNLVGDILRSISDAPARSTTNLIGEVASGWGDKGINPEAYWLGYVAGAAAGWHPGALNPQAAMSEFYSVFYGSNVVDMDRLYQLMSEQDQTWGDSWDTVPSTSRKGIWGEAYGQIYNPRKPASDQALPLPPSPGMDLAYNSTWSSENAKRIDLALEAKEGNDTLLGLIHENIQRAQFNRYNLEVYLTIADLYRQNITMIAGIHGMDAALAAAAKIKDKDPKAAIAYVDSALDIATSIREERNVVLQNLVTTWDKSWFQRVEEANGRHFLHELDDVKDHEADRTTDLSYLIYREKILPFGEWVNSILAARNQFAAAHQLPTREYRMAWDDLKESAHRLSNVPVEY